MGYAAFLAAIIVVQIANLLICKTRRLSLFQQGLRTYENITCENIFSF